MNVVNRGAALAAIVAGLAITTPVGATNGYFALGYGAKSMAMGGAGISNPQDRLAPAANPAGLAFVDPGWDAGVRLFSPSRDSRLTATAFASGATRQVEADSGRELFAIPNFGYLRALSPRVKVGIALYGNGGLNTHFERNIFDESLAVAVAGVPGPPSPFPPPGLPAGATATGTPNTGTLGVDLSQALIPLTVTYNVTNEHSLGLSLVGGFQKFSSRGLGNFAPLSSDPGSLTNRQSDLAVGVGVRVGWIGKVHPMVTLGANYASKVYMTKFTRYSGLFADGGSFDIPAHFGFGISLHMSPKTTIAIDAQRILYGDVDSIANPGPTAAEFQAAFSPAGLPDPTRRLGASNGIGFGWESVWVFKVGVRHDLNRSWTLRAGFNHGDSPIPEGSGQLLFNLLAPAAVENHVTVGASYRPDANSEVTIAYMHAFENRQSESSTAFFGFPASFSMNQNSLEFMYSRQF